MRHKDLKSFVKSLALISTLICGYCSASSEDIDIEKYSVEDLFFELLNRYPGISYSERSNWKRSQGRLNSWNFTTENHPAHPSMFRLEYIDTWNATYKLTFLCESEEQICQSMKKQVRAAMEEFRVHWLENRPNY